MGMLLKWSSPYQYPYEISTASALRFLIYGLDKIFQVQGHYSKVKGQIKVTLWQGTTTLPNQCSYQIWTSYTLQCLRYGPERFLCQLTCQSADIMSSLCGVCVRVRVRVRVTIFFSKTTSARDMQFFLNESLPIDDEKLFKACRSVCSFVLQNQKCIHFHTFLHFSQWLMKGLVWKCACMYRTTSRMLCVNFRSVCFLTFFKARWKY